MTRSSQRRQPGLVKKTEEIEPKSSLHFTPIPPELRTLVASFSPSKFYILHADTHAAPFKRKIFIVPVLLNIAVIVLLLWRAYVEIPFYFGLLVSMQGTQNQYTIDLPKHSTGELVWICLGRTLSFAIDWALYSFFLPWPRDFFFSSPTSPAEWRWRAGFQDHELVVRVSRAWGQELLQNNNVSERDVALKEKASPAVDPMLLAQKTGYVLMNADWDLDFNAMLVAHELVSKKVIDLDKMETGLLAHLDERQGWMIWYPAPGGGIGSGGDGRKTIIDFRKKLEAMGKEKLFYRWVELVQYESTKPGGFTQERQLETMRQAKELFEKEGVDFEEFWESVGGMKHMPSVENPDDLS